MGQSEDWLTGSIDLQIGEFRIKPDELTSKPNQPVPRNFSLLKFFNERMPFYELVCIVRKSTMEEVRE